MGPSGPLGGWAVGYTPSFMPDGLALPIGKGSDIIVQLHFHSSGKPETERSTIGIYFADKAPERRLMTIGQPGFFGLLAGIDNPRNPSNPPKRVRWGLESFDEMGAVQFFTTTTNPQDELTMQRIGAAVVKAAIGRAQQDGTVQRIQEQLQKQNDAAKQ